MAKYSGMIGFVTTEEKDPVNHPSVYEDVVVEKRYFGDLLRNIRKWETGEGLLDDLNVNNSVSIVADPYAHINWPHIRYITMMGTRWKVTNIEVNFPRLILSVGGVYNGPTPESGSDSENEDADN